MTNYLVTGGAGFIGSHIVRQLCKNNHKVRILDNFSSGKESNLKGINGDLEIHKGDIRDLKEVRSAVDGVEIIFHEAAFVSNPRSILEPAECYDVNVHGTENLLEEARKTGVRRIVLASSAAVYGDAADFPTREETPLQPLSPYAASKVINEIYASMYSRTFGIEVVALRYYNVYGPNQSPDSEYAAAIPIFIQNLIHNKKIHINGDGGQTRDLVHVQDIVQANLKASESPNASGRVINICSGTEVSVLNLVNILRSFINSSDEPEFGPARKGDIYKSLGDPQLAWELLDFKPKITLSEGLSKTMEWMKSCQ